MRVLTANQINDACVRGDFVFIGNRQRVSEATESHDLGEPAPGKVWVNLVNGGWTEVKLAEVSIDRRNGDPMTLKGKRENGRPTHVSTSKRGAAKQPELPGVEQEKVPALERAAKKYNDLKEPFADARDKLSSAKDTLIKMMHDKVKPNDDGELVYKRGDVKVTIKPSKEKLKVVIGEDEDSDEVEIEEEEE